MGRLAGQVSSVVLLAGIYVARACADCAPFYDSLNNQESIESNDGVVTGSIAFAPAVNDDGVVFGPTAHVTYETLPFNTSQGTVSLWFKKTSAQAEGGICQIGTLSQPNSLGLFYVGQDDVCFEVRNNSGDLGQIFAEDILSPTEWTHIAAAWSDRGDACDMWLFVNGGFTAYGYLPGIFLHAASPLQIGVTGFYGHGQGGMDELCYFDWDLLDSEVYAEYVYSSNRHRRQPTAKPVSTGNVQIIGELLCVEGHPFKVKGVGYAPTPIGSWPDYPTYTDPGIIARDIPMLQQMHVNTVRTWAQPQNSTLLDALYYNGGDPIYVIMGFWIPTSGVDYGDPATITFYEGEFRDFVNQFKAHPGVLGWGIGNEVNLHLSGQDLANWYALANRLAEVAYEEEGEAYHPTIVVNGGMLGLGNVDRGSDDISMSYIDIWGNNVYFGEDAHCYFDYYSRLSAKPLICTEFGIDAYDNRTGAEYQDVQAEWVVRQWGQIESACVGGTVMAYSDEWWKAGEPNTQDPGGYATKTHPDGFSNEEWWGMVWVEDNGNEPDIVHPRQVYYALGQEFEELCLGDINGDGNRDFTDFTLFSNAWQTSVGDLNYDPAADLNGDGNVDFTDFTIFSNGWLVPCP